MTTGQAENKTEQKKKEISKRNALIRSNYESWAYIVDDPKLLKITKELVRHWR